MDYNFKQNHFVKPLGYSSSVSGYSSPSGSDLFPGTFTHTRHIVVHVAAAAADSQEEFK